MTREEAITRLKNMAWLYGSSEREQNIEAIDMAIEALSAEPTDLISRAEAIKAIESRQTEQWIDADVDYNNGLESAVAEIKALPSADRPSGEWIKHNDRSTIIVYYTCSECGEVESGTPTYCRKCGAKMGSDTK